MFLNLNEMAEVNGFSANAVVADDLNVMSLMSAEASLSSYLKSYGTGLDVSITLQGLNEVPSNVVGVLRTALAAAFDESTQYSANESLTMQSEYHSPASELDSLSAYSQMVSVTTVVNKVGETLRRMWEAIKNAARKAVYWIKKTFQGWYSSSKRMRERLLNILKDLKKASGDAADRFKTTEFELTESVARHIYSKREKFPSKDAVLDVSAYKELDKFTKVVVPAITDGLIKANSEWPDSVPKDEKSFVTFVNSAIKHITPDSLTQFAGRELPGGYFLVAQKTSLYATTSHPTEVTTFELHHNNLGGSNKSESKDYETTKVKLPDIKTWIEFCEAAISVTKNVADEYDNVEKLALSRERAMKAIDKMIDDNEKDHTGDGSGEYKFIRQFVNMYSNTGTQFLTKVSSYCWSQAKFMESLLESVISAAKLPRTKD